jgi:hypothetical protein
MSRGRPMLPFVRSTRTRVGPLQSLLAVSNRSSSAYSTKNCPLLGPGWSFDEPQVHTRWVMTKLGYRFDELVRCSVA